jgi:hypothetical protein
MDGSKDGGPEHQDCDAKSYPQADGVQECPRPQKRGQRNLVRAQQAIDAGRKIAVASNE